MTDSVKAAWHDRFTVVHRMMAIGILTVTAVMLVGLMHEKTIDDLNGIDEQVVKLSDQMEILDGLTGQTKWQDALALRLVEGQSSLGSAYESTWNENEQSLKTLQAGLPSKALRELAAKQTESMMPFDREIRDFADAKEKMGLTEKEGLRGELRSAVHAIEGRLKQVGNDRVMVSMLMLRRHEKDFMLRGTEKYLQKHAKEAAHFVTLLNQSGMTDANRSTIKAELEQYTQALANYAAQKQNMSNKRKSFGKIFNEQLLPGMNAMDAALGKEMADVRAELDAIHASQGVTFWSISLVCLLLIMLLLWMIARSVVTPLREISSALDALDDGDTSHTLNIQIQGVIGQLVESYDKLTLTVKEAFQLKAIVEVSPQATMLANQSDLVVNYMNPAALNLFRTLEEDLPCKADEIVGQCIDIFHRKPSHQRHLLSSAANFPHHASFMVGDRNIEFDAYAIYDNDGTWQSVMVSWNDVTERSALANDFETNVGGVVSEIQSYGDEMQQAAEQLSAMAVQSSAQAESVSGSSQQASDNVMTVASASEELSASIGEITRQVHEAAQISAAAVEEASSANTTVSELSEVSEQIGEVVRVISEIAEQTNLLALNASIEAARAGDAGRGFAVVASEVKELANQTARATEQIAGQIGAIQRQSGGAAEAISHIGSVIQRMNDINKSIAEATEQQNEATREIAQSVHYASEATHQASDDIAGVSTASEETGKAAAGVLDVANALTQKGAELSSRVSDFLGALRR
ncbi:HAMP domain-containing protein [Mariprofundus sp. EBB-1]|uniref:methyl-accepting chemotaxis protein n=1 Tax=Mariprofundus sp. EBB-1 TaxID=2650971 RepID=UPI000EF25475|nr:HAMP domain-containing methyl-accepting chemotaxis protein [Mariprofundus sp. EBB-1]RLL55089.1 HAMP domain-containing protein [Mariprofundus sp. EBB-1]